MFFIKKSSLFFSKAILFQYCFYNKNILAFYDYFSFSNLDFLNFKNLILYFNLSCLSLSSSFVNFLFNFTFFFFLKPSVFMVYTDMFNEFFQFNLKVKDIGSFFFIGFSFKKKIFNSCFLLTLNYSLFNITLFNLYLFIFNFFEFFIYNCLFILKIFTLFFLCYH